MEENREKEVMEAAIQAGHLLLENGAEISRVEETMERIFRYYGVESGSTFVLSNGIFATAGSSKESFFAKVEHIPVSGTHLNRVAAVNQLSREIEEGRYSPAEAAERLNAIRCPERQKRCRFWRRAAAALPFAICLAEARETVRRHLQQGLRCMPTSCM